MSRPYEWRRMTPEQRKKALLRRQDRHHPWHSPPHRYREGKQHFHVTAACFEHRPHIGWSEPRMDDFAASLLDVMERAEATVSAWVVLPNHYHVLLEAPIIAKVLFELGQVHGKTSLAWNREEGAVGRKNFHRAVERTIRSDAHYLATLNYVHHNPVWHGYVEKWTDWPWSSASAFLERVGKETAATIWRDYPVLDYGAGWDDPDL